MLNASSEKRKAMWVGASSFIVEHCKWPPTPPLPSTKAIVAQSRSSDRRGRVPMR